LEPDPAGEVLVLAEADYLYGAGRLTLRVEHIDRAHPIEYDGEPWFPVRGIEISANGVDIGKRETMVRAKRLFKAPDPA
jgi:hypothetical protein